MDYTTEDAARVFAQPIEDVRAWLERMAVEQRPDVERAIAVLSGGGEPG